MIAKLRSSGEAREKVWEMIKDIKVAMLVTMGEDARHFARPMVVLEPSEHKKNLWFFLRLLFAESGTYIHHARLSGILGRCRGHYGLGFWLCESALGG
jgi:hypothetical protein